MSTRDPTAAVTDTSASTYTTRAKRERIGGDGIYGPRYMRSEGQRLLLQVPGTYDEICERIGATRNTVTDWRKGTRVPHPSARVRMLDALGIPVEAWAMPWHDPNAPAAAPAAPAAIESAPPAQRAPDPHSLGDAPVAVRGTNIEQCLDLLAVIRRDRSAPNLLPSERVKLVDSESKVLKLLADLQARAELAEDRYVREHPAWVRVRNAIAEALKPHPAAAQAVAAALDRLGI